MVETNQELTRYLELTPKSRSYASRSRVLEDRSHMERHSIGAIVIRSESLRLNPPTDTTYLVPKSEVGRSTHTARRRWRQRPGRTWRHIFAIAG